MRHPSLIPLSHDHHHALALALRCRKQALGQTKPMGAAGLKERAAEVHGFFTDNLVKHFRAEEEALFPMVRELVPSSGPIIDRLLTEHKQIRALIGRLESEAAVSKTLFDLGDLLERHVRAEERELFPLFEQHIGVEDAALAAAQIKKFLA